MPNKFTICRVLFITSIYEANELCMGNYKLRGNSNSIRGGTVKRSITMNK